MKIASWNVRGLNGVDRQKVVSLWLRNLGYSVVALLETHVQEENVLEVFQKVSQGRKFENNYSEVNGGRIWVLWDPLLSVITYWKSDQMVLCGVFDPRSGKYCTVAFVYAHNTEIQRRELWADLVRISSLPLVVASPFLVMGDFNQILTSDEHFSLVSYDLPVRGMADFRDCLTQSSLADIEVRGVFFSWTNKRPEDPIIRKLDRALGNDKWRETFPDAVGFFEAPGDSDHSPCVVEFSAEEVVRKPSFKYFSFIATHPKFLTEMKETWEEPVQVGSKLFTLGQRLKKVKKLCKKLNKEGFGNIQQRAKDAMQALKTVQEQLLTAPSESLFREEFVCRKKWLFFEEAQAVFFNRKARIRWLICGDANTTFFHKAVIAHQVRNAINYLMDANDQRVVNPLQIKEMVVSYFRNLLGTMDAQVVPLSVEEIQSLFSFRCSEPLRSALIQLPSVTDIKEVINAMPKNKAPGPDGFAAEFYWEAWEVVGEDTIAAILEFFVSGRMLPQFNATAVSLIPKITGADRLTQFGPISLCSTIYKVISRILKKKLKLFIAEVIQRNQVGFVQDRLLCENVLLASELVTDFHVHGPTRRGCLKIDLSKAYDKLNLEFVTNTLRALDLPDKFVEWLRECYMTASYSIVVNGELNGHFQGKQGLRQGDPISSLLFVTAMDVLSKMLDRGAMEGVFAVHPECEAPLITHLSFADDVLIFFDGSEESLRGILQILEDFKKVSGLSINREKTELLLDGGSNERCRALAEAVGIAQGSLPVRYLGVPLSSKKMKKPDFQPLLDKINARFNSWTVRHLSFAGRFQLIQAVIYSTISFWASIFILPSDCISELERMCNAFLWRGVPTSARGAKVAWDSVCTPKEEGGLGLKRLADWNEVLGLKLIWLIFTAGGSLWVSWVRRNLIGEENFWLLDPRRSRKGSWIWKAICKLRSTARPMVQCEVGSGITASFWLDNWTGRGPIIELTGDRGPMISGLPITASVADALREDGWWLDRSRSRSPVIQTIKQCLPDAGLILNSEEEDDLYVWKPLGVLSKGTFSTAETWSALYPQGTHVFWHKTVWFSGRIPKHAFLTWVAARDRLVTRDRLLRWGLQVPAVCVLCNGSNETRQHLFFDCPYSKEVWLWFTSRLRLAPPSEFDALLGWMVKPSSNSNIEVIIKLLFQASIYFIWKERNSRVHSDVTKPSSALIAEIKNLIRLKLDPLSRNQRELVGGLSLLGFWLNSF